jgi:methylphosphotriester-DNA--protein-cysteine methyltransferase
LEIAYCLFVIRHSNFEDNYTGSKQLYELIAAGKITFAGNRRLKIYGRLNCASGKRMKRINRVFFVSEEEAVAEGFRPCGHCMKKQYELWKR